jgi:glycosyltransferase involved in cell wall biosynthesis
VRILFVTSLSPFGASFGGQQRTALLYQALCKHGQVDVVIVEPGPKNVVTGREPNGVAARVQWREPLLRLTNYRPSKSLTASLETALGVSLTTYDLIVGRYLTPICKLVMPEHVWTVVDVDDIRRRYGMRLRGLSDVLLRAKGAIANYLAGKQLARFNGFIFVSERDQAAYPNVHGITAPNIPYSRDLSPTFSPASNAILFVGSLWYRPNLEGVQWFIDRVWPQVRQSVPQASFVVVGSGAREYVERWRAIPGVTPVGFVEDLNAMYKSAAVAVSPVFSGGGSNIKVLEALAHGRACVTTSFCSNAFAETFRAGAGLLVADDRVTFANHCIMALTHRDNIARIARRGWEEVCAHYSEAVFQSAIDRVVLESKRSARTSSQQ